MSAFDLVRIARATGAKLSVDSGSLVLEADNPPPQEVFDGLRAHKAEILELLREERRAIVMWINDHFKSSPPGRCAHCGGATSADDPFVKMFVDEDRADVHASCHPAWVAEQEGEARVALGIETSAGIRPECDASCIETKGEMKTSPSQQTIANRVDCVAGALTVQQAEKSPVGAERFLQIAKRNPQKKRHKLTRVPFQVSRLMEFCSLRELQNQTGHNVLDWPLVVLKELLDNALDACEEVAVAPVVKVSVSPKTGTIVIEDNGPGIPEETVRAVCDYTIRVSSREAYVSPSRGAQGNALKTILAMGYVLDRERLSQGHADAAEATGRTTIETRGVAHTILFLVDHVTNEPQIAHTTAPSPITIGTRITIKWPQSPHGRGSVLDDAEEQFKALAENYVWFNPHLTLSGAWDGADFVNAEATNPDWTKWRPSDPTSPHWYTEARLQRYLSAHVARDRRLGQGEGRV